MSERGTELMGKASRQLVEIVEFFSKLGEADLRKPSPDCAGETVGAAAAHLAEGYYYLGRFLQATGYVSGSSATGHTHGRGPAPHLSDMVHQSTGGRIPIGLLADLTDEQFDSVPPKGSSRFSDGRRTLEQVIDGVIAHQAAHLATLKRAVAAPWKS